MHPTTFRRLLVLVPALALGACAPPPRQERVEVKVTRPEEALAPVPAGRAPELRDDGDRESLALAIERSLAWLDAQPPERALVFGPRTVSAQELARALRDVLALLASAPSPELLERGIRARFDLYEAVGGKDGGMLVTGYYEPEIAASAEPTAEYAVPIYARPEDLIEVALGSFSERLEGQRIAGRVDGKRLVPYWNRSEIGAAGPLSGRGLELAWARDPVDLFFVEVQGSGVLHYPDGSERRIGYAAANGRTYRSIGKLLIDEGSVPKERMSMQAIRGYLREHPEEVERVLAYNDSKVFFHFLSGPSLGSLGQPVTPGRSVATDLSLMPRAALGFLLTERPALAADGTVVTTGRLGRFVLNQDTGGAIRGAGRVDFFWGRGAEAEAAAGAMRHQGRLIFLVPR